MRLDRDHYSQVEPPNEERGLILKGDDVTFLNTSFTLSRTIDAEACLVLLSYGFQNPLIFRKCSWVKVDHHTTYITFSHAQCQFIG